MKYKDLFGNKKPIFGMVHLGCFNGNSVLKTAQREIEIYLKHGVYPLIENYFGSASDCEEVLAWIQQAHPDAIYGINILGDYTCAFDLAQQYGAKFIQIDSVCGHLEPEEDEMYAEGLKACRKKCDVVLLGGVRFKYQAVRSGRTTEEDLKLGMQRCDTIVCTGAGTGLTTPVEKVEKFKDIVGDFPVIVGAGVTLAAAEITAQMSDGTIVGSWFKERHDAHNPLVEDYVQQFVQQWKMGLTRGLEEMRKALYKKLKDKPFGEGIWACFVRSEQGIIFTGARCPDCGHEMIDIIVRSSEHSWQVLCGREYRIPFCPHCGKEGKRELTIMS